MKIDRSILTANDQENGQVGDPNKLESSINHLADIIDSNDGDTSVLKTDNASNKSRLSTLETDNTSNKSRITANEGNISYDQAKLDNLLRNTQQASEVVAARMKADGTSFPILGDRLNDVDSSLAQKASQSDVYLKADKTTVTALDTKINSQASGSPKGIYATASALTTAFPTGNSNIYVVTADGNWYYWNGTAWTPGGVYQSAGIGDRTVLPRSTTFYKVSKNTFDAEYVLGGINGTGGEYADATGASARSGYVSLLPNTQYTISFEGIDGLNYYVHFYDSSKVHLRNTAASASKKITFTTESTDAFIRVATYKSGATAVIPTKTQLELGAVATDYVPNMVIDKNYFDVGVIEPKHTTFFEKNRNIFNSVWNLGGVNSNGTFSTNLYAHRSDYVNVEANKEYTVSFTSNIPLYHYFYFYDASKTFISSTPGLIKDEITFTTPANTAFVIVSTYKDGAIATDLIPLTTQLEVGNEATEYVPYGLQLDKTYIDNDHIKNEISKNMPFILQNAQFENTCIKGIAHRGYSYIAPENTAPSYILARKMGFKYVECDLQFTLDGVPVLNHNLDINHNSNGTGYIKDMTLAQLQTYDFGSWKDPRYVGTKILKFEDFIKLCKKLGLKPYIDLKAELVDMSGVVNIVKKYGMLRQVSWSGWTSILDKIRTCDSKARILYTQNDAPTDWSVLTSRITDENNVVLNMLAENITQEISDIAVSYGIPLEAWIVDDEALLIQLSEMCLTGVTTDKLNVPQVLLNSI